MKDTPFCACESRSRAAFVLPTKIRLAMERERFCFAVEGLNLGRRLWIVLPSSVRSLTYDVAFGGAGWAETVVADTTKYVLLAANNSLESVVHVHEKIIF